jgi:hypothetical protein
MTPRWGGQIHDFTLMRGSVDDADSSTRGVGSARSEAAASSGRKVWMASLRSP